MKVSHACTRTTLVNKLDKYDKTIAIVYVVRFIFLCPIRSQHLLDPLDGLVGVGTQGIFHPCSHVLKNFRHTFSPTATDFPWFPKDAKTFDSTANK